MSTIALPDRGTLYAVTVQLGAPIVDGSLTVRAMVNGTGVGVPLILTSASPLVAVHVIQQRIASPGALLGIEATGSVDLDPAPLSVQAWAWVSLDRGLSYGGP